MCIWTYSFLYCIFFKLFCPIIKKPNIHNNIAGISSFQNGLNNLCSSNGFYFRSKVIEGSHKGKNMFFNFWALLLKMCIFEVVTFFFRLVAGYPINSIFQWQYVIYKIHVFDEAFFLLTIRMPMVTKLFRVVTCWEELLLMNMHDISKEWPFGGHVTSKIHISTCRRCIDTILGNVLS